MREQCLTALQLPAPGCFNVQFWGKQNKIFQSVVPEVAGMTCSQAGDALEALNKNSCTPFQRAIFCTLFGY